MPPLNQPREDAPTKPTALVTNVLREGEVPVVAEVEVAGLGLGLGLGLGRSLPAYADTPAANARADTTLFMFGLIIYCLATN